MREFVLRKRDSHALPLNVNVRVTNCALKLEMDDCLIVSLWLFTLLTLNTDFCRIFTRLELNVFLCRKLDEYEEFYFYIALTTWT